MGILIKAYGNQGFLEEAIQLFKEMINRNMRINDITYGSILDACAKRKKMDLALEIYNSLESSHLNFNSIVFTTVVKGFIKSKAYKEALDFFKRIKVNTDLPGMIITFNCALDVYVRMQDISSALELFKEINNTFGADLISYSTIIKGLC